MSLKIFRRSLKSFRRGCQNCMLRVRRKTLRKEIFWKASNPFWKLSHSFSGISVRFLGRVVKLAFYVSINYFEKIFVPKKILFRYFLDLSGRCLAVDRNFFDGDANTAFCVSMEKFWDEFLIRKILFLNLSWALSNKFQAIRRKSLRWGWQNCVLYVQSINLRENIVCPFFFEFFWTSNKKFPGLW